MAGVTCHDILSRFGSNGLLSYQETHTQNTDSSRKRIKYLGRKVPDLVHIFFFHQQSTHSLESVDINQALAFPRVDTQKPRHYYLTIPINPASHVQNHYYHYPPHAPPRSSQPNRQPRFSDCLRKQDQPQLRSGQPPLSAPRLCSAM